MKNNNKNEPVITQGPEEIFFTDLLQRPSIPFKFRKSSELQAFIEFIESKVSSSKKSKKISFSISPASMDNDSAGTDVYFYEPHAFLLLLARKKIILNLRSPVKIMLNRNQIVQFITDTRVHEKRGDISADQNVSFKLIDPEGFRRISKAIYELRVPDITVQVIDRYFADEEDKGKQNKKSGYWIKKSDARYYFKDKLVKMNPTTQYYIIFDVVYSIAEKGGDVEYEKIIECCKKRNLPTITRKKIQRALTGKSAIFFKQVKGISRIISGGYSLFEASPSGKFLTFYNKILD